MRTRTHACVRAHTHVGSGGVVMRRAPQWAAPRRCRNASAAAARNLRPPPPHQSAMRRLRRRRPLVQVQRAMADPIIDAAVGAAKAKARLCADHAGMCWGQRLRVAQHGTARSARHRTVPHAAWWLSRRTMPGGMRACAACRSPRSRAAQRRGRSTGACSWTTWRCRRDTRLAIATIGSVFAALPCPFDAWGSGCRRSERPSRAGAPSRRRRAMRRHVARVFAGTGLGHIRAGTGLAPASPHLRRDWCGGGDGQALPEDLAAYLSSQGQRAHQRCAPHTPSCHGPDWMCLYGV